MPAFPTSLPAPRVPDVGGMPALRWGVLGTGWIANRFAASVTKHTNQQIIAVGSRDRDRAAAFAARHRLPRIHYSYEQLVQDDAIDVVYIATTHESHLACARLALEAGKPVLVEKPLAINSEQAAEIAELAAARDLFCMEALWTCFLPKFDVIRQLLDTGVLGEVHTVLADHGEHFLPDHRIFNPALGGGPLLDLGLYPVALATTVFGEIANVLAAGQWHDSGVNAQATAVLCDPAGNQAVIHTTLLSNTPTSATIAGTAATLTLDGPFFQPGSFKLSSADGEHRLQWTERATGHDALYVEALEVARCLAAGERESTLRPLRDSVSTLRILDEIRRQCGISFACEAQVS